MIKNKRELQKNLSPLGAWSYSIGTSVGWGSLVVTASTYLAQAGPAGSVFGLVVGALIMLVVSRNYAYMMRCCPESGGAYAFARDAFGYDHGVLMAWFLAMTYFAILWANATSLPLFGRIFLGGVFRVGRLYSVFGYEVFLGEVLLSIAGLVIFGILSARQSRVTNMIMIVLACLFTVAIVICFVGALAGGGSFFSPAYIPDTGSLSQILKIAVISPWAFIGFESISHRTEEFTFSHNRIHRILVISVISTLVLYVLVTLLSVTAYPSAYDSWFSYIKDLDNLEGLEALPAFYAASRYLGNAGVTLLMLALLALVITSLIGNMTALSRLIYSLGKEQILPQSLGKLGNNDIPQNAVYFVMGVSCLIPFVGRTAIGWIVDVTTIGATLIYAMVSACTAKMAKELGNRSEVYSGRIGAALSILLGAVFLLPNLLSRSSLATETYLLFIAWVVLGFLFFRYILHHDKEKRFGSSTIVWVALLVLVLLISLIWMRQSMLTSNDKMMQNIQQYYEEHNKDEEIRPEDEQYIKDQLEALEASDTRTMLMAIGMFAFALAIMMTNHSYMNKRTRESEMLANRDPMTGVLSKHAFLVKERSCDAEIEGGTADEFAIVVCDVNGLKKINDTLGHKAGDEYIRTACTMVCDIFQHSPVYRVGGDEFVAVLTGRDYTVRKELMMVLHERSVEHIDSGGAVVSGGISDYLPEEDSNFHQVFERADSLMYEEKKLLKSLGAVTRDEEPEAETDLLAEIDRADPILNVRRHILVVEDEIVNQMLLGNGLEEEYEVLYAGDGVEAMEKLKIHKDELALVLLDLQMPRMTGEEVLRIMQEEPELRNIPVIVLTADEQAEVECLKNGAADFIPKPYPSWEIIRARVDKCIELSENRDIIQSTERDSLTRLFNVDYFNRYVHKFDTHFEDKPMDAVVVDVNHFHMINERFGKNYADSILKKIGERIRQVSREVGGVGCRQGADTFYLYCPHREDYQELLNRILDSLSGETSAGRRIRLRMGVYGNVDKSLDIERRFDRAKIAAQNVKNSFGDSVGIYDEKMHKEALYRERLLEDFPSSLEQNRFLVYFQPKFDVRPDKPLLASAEALVRWDHPELGMISPGVFIPLLEENGLILKLDYYVWEQTAARIRDWKDRFGYSVPVSVNVSRIDMLLPNLKSLFTGLLEKYGLDHKDLILEITESAYTGDSEQVISTARDLRGVEMGFRIEMDDFGTGYSSLGMLANLPIDALKLDMTFVRSAFGETRDVRMIELIIDIADYLHVPVVAEGVETEEQYLGLKELGCDYVQGYYFSKPVPMDEFDRFLLERGK